MHVFCPPPGGVPSAVKLLNPLSIVRLEGVGYISEYELAGMAWDVEYLYVFICT